MKYTVEGLRKTWFEFYKKKGHVIIPSAGVIPENDPTSLFYNSGMHPLVPYLMGEKHPSGKRLANVQKCIRTGDIDEVGDRTHLTFFEMLGNWSLGDYFKEEQIPWSFEFLTQELNLPLERLAVSAFEGDDNSSKDEEAANAWIKAGMPKEKIAFLNAAENWWAKGPTGPCGPDSEMFYWTGDINDPELKKPYQETWENPNWVEFWNDVFMEFNKTPKGNLEKLPSQNVDTGMGLDRTVMILNGFTSVYQTDAFDLILKEISQLAQNENLYNDKIGKTTAHYSSRIIADHIRAAVVILADKVSPGNVDQGYILRRLIRRAIRHGRKLEITQNFTKQIAKVVINILGAVYPDLKQNTDFILSELETEETQFRKTLEKGEKQFHKAIQKVEGKISGELAFDLFQTYGFPLEITQELAQESNLEVDEKDFEKAFKEHQEKSRTASSGKFKGGLSQENIEKETQYHTATHLLLAGLREVLGEHVHQSGSNITAERLRFDFSHGEKLTPEQKTSVEEYVNQAIQAQAQQFHSEIPKTDAKNDPQIEGSFWDKYPDIVKVYEFKDETGKTWTKELCGGPHVKNTNELGTFKIKKEQASSQGVRRIKAILIENK